MGTIKSGLNSKTSERIFVGAGAIYLDYGLSTERRLGATRGGNEFNLNREIREVEIDGVKGPTKGLRRVTVVKPQITCNLIELSLDNLIKAIAGANQDESDYQVAVEAEYLKEGNDVALTALGNDNIVENSERAFLDGVLLTRSTKYDSRFVGDNAADNKNFELGVGDWVKGHANDVIDIEADGYDGNCMRYTSGNDVVVTKFLNLPGGSGAQLTNLVVGEYYKVRIALKRVGTFTPTITVACDAGSKAAIAPTTSWVVHVIEFTATGTDASISLTGSAAPSDTEVLHVSYLELERVDGDYVMNWETGEIIYAEADIPTTGEELTISYTHKSGDAVTHDIIRGGDIDLTDYISNVALVGTISGKTNDVICIVENALADAGLSLSTAHRDEAVPSIVFTGHYDPATPTIEPWEIRYPRA